MVRDEEVAVVKGSCELTGDGFRAEFDVERGVVRGLRDRTDSRETNFIGTADNISDQGFLADPAWLGDVVLQTWRAGAWRKELTTRSSDLRVVSADPSGRRVEVRYEGASSDEEGLRTVAVREAFYAEKDCLRWDVTLTNQTQELLEVGEVAFPLTMNIDYAALFRGPGKLDDDAERQRAWHEDKVMMHLSICGHSSYGLFQRPSGEGRSLLFHAVGDTSLEAAYKMDNVEGSHWDVVWEGQHLVAAHSWARKQANVWNAPRDPQRSWINGHSFLLLRPGESKAFRFRFAFVANHNEVEEELVRHGRIAVRVRPAMVVPIKTAVRLQVRSQEVPTLLPEASDVEVEKTASTRAPDLHEYTLRFGTRGQKKIRVLHGDGKWTNVLFYALPPFSELIKARAKFMVDRQLYESPHDPYGRQFAFLPYDTMVDALFLESDEAWQVGGSDEYGLPIAMFLAEKNVHLPDKQEIDALERFVDGFLFRTLQSPATYEIRRGMVWSPDHPSRQPWQWDKKTAELTTRTFNYPLAANIYHSMYKIGRTHGLLSRRTPEQYLDICWHTAMKWLEIGKHWNYGAPAGANLVNILDDLERDAPEKYEQLLARVSHVVDIMEKTPYPFGSELYVDQTGHDQVHALMTRFGHREKVRKTLRVTKALRAGGQPVWFWYGNEKRGNVSCWYAQTQNSRVLFSGFEETGDPEMLAWGYGGLTSFLTTIQDSGAVRGWFLWWPDRMGFDLRSLDTDLGLYSYLLAAKAYVVEDEAFGLVGYGCDVDRDKTGTYRVVPWDGLRKRLWIAPLGIDVRVEKGEIARVAASPRTGELSLTLEDTTGLVPEAAFEISGAGVISEACVVLKGTGAVRAVSRDCVRVQGPLLGTADIGLRLARSEGPR